MYLCNQNAPGSARTGCENPERMRCGSSGGALRLRRIRGEPLPPRRWSLGRYGGIINDLTLCFLVVAFFFSFWPSYVLVGDATALADFNWAVVVLAIVGILAFVYYFAGGRNKYVAPVSLVKTE